ncbi:MAG: thioredoxin domain-containing protein [Candidatus Odinarchaeota archaeon]
MQPDQNDNQQPNRLIREKSPYLLQHAYNSVNWYPWEEEAFEKAQKENKPIFLSIGYSSCHWCHVMRKESFEDSEIASSMNDTFVCIKVDREERPDIDTIYMKVCQMLTGSGGWPLTIIMTPDKRPFFAGTYFPKEGRFGRTGMRELVSKIKNIWEIKREEVLESANSITEMLQKTSVSGETEELGIETLKLAYARFYQDFDEYRGGFGGAPKFPTPHNLLFLLRYWKRAQSDKTLLMVEKTLKEMRMGGIFDHLGFGFHRYSTDINWLVPHFEKMLYDQAMLAMAYIEAYQATGKHEYERTAREIFAYVTRDMKSPEGGFYSAEDADSEGEEGKFYLWTEEEIRKVLDDEDAELAIKIFNIETRGNFVDQIKGKRTGENILHMNITLEQAAADLKIPVEELGRYLEVIRTKLFSKREERVHPHKDDKILTDWNGLMVAAFAKGGRVFNDSSYNEIAKEAVHFILSKLRNEQGRLLHRYREGEAGITATIDDYMFLIWGLLELYETTFDVKYLKAAIELNKDAVNYFWDNEFGGFFFTPVDGEELITRPKDVYDGAIPSGNSVGMLNLVKLGRITARPDLEEKASLIAKAFSSVIGQAPSAFTLLLTALDFAVGPSHEVVITGKTGSIDTKEMLKALRKQYLPNKIVIFKADDGEQGAIEQIASYVKDQKSLDGTATAYICQNYVCNRPVTEISEMLALMNK